MKICSKCEQEKSIDCFGKDKYKKDGLSFSCKVCVNVRNKKYQLENIEKVKVYTKKYREENRELLRLKSNESFIQNREKRLEQGRRSYFRCKTKIATRIKLIRSTDEGRKKESERQNKYRKNNPEIYKRIIRRWQIINRKKVNAHAKVHRAVKNGSLIRSDKCNICGKICKTEGHHEDYSKPLDVIWLCKNCHTNKHKEE